MQQAVYLPSIMRTTLAFVLLSTIETQGFTVLSPLKASLPILHAEFGELSVPDTPQFEDALIEQARARLDWETGEPSDEGWESGELWSDTRAKLIQKWILPRDMSNGADARYASAASKQEIKMLAEVPQLMRLDTVLDSVQVLLHAGLPPALLRTEPELLAFPPKMLQDGIDLLTEKHGSKKEAVIVCRDTPGLLVETVAAV